MNRDRNCKTPLFSQNRPLFSPIDAPNPISRREFIYRGSATAIILVGAPLILRNQQAMANPVLPWLAWTGGAAFAGSISWFVGRVLDKMFPYFGNTHKAGNKLANELNVKKVIPKPTEDKFHNRYASPYVVGNRDYLFDSAYSDRFEYYVGLNPYLRSDSETPLPEFKDLSTPEIRRIAYEEDFYKTILFPCNKRRPSVRADHRGYISTCKEYGVDPGALELEYVRPFNDGTKEYLAYGVESKRTRGKDLLISV